MKREKDETGEEEEPKWEQNKAGSKTEQTKIEFYPSSDTLSRMIKTSNEIDQQSDQKSKQAIQIEMISSRKRAMESLSLSPPFLSFPPKKVKN